MSKQRVLRCSQETYRIVAWYAGEKGLSLAESLEQLVRASSSAPGKPTPTGEQGLSANLNAEEVATLRSRATASVD